MVSGRGVSALVCVAICLFCVGSVVMGHGRDSGAVVRVPPAIEARDAVPVPAPPPAAAAASAVEVDVSLPTGSIAPGSALHAPNPAAYADAAKAGASLIVTGAEAIN